MKESNRLREEIKMLELEYADLKKMRKHLEQSLKDTVDRINKLDGGPWGRGDGIISDRKQDLEAALRKEKDEESEVVEVTGRYGGNSQYVFRRITAKSIFLATPGQKSEMRFGLDGNGPYGTIVDVESLLERHGKKQ